MITANQYLVESLPLGSFKQYTKSAPVYVMHMKDAVAAGVVGKDLVIQTLEGPVTGNMESVLCRGWAGEMWTTKLESVLKKYKLGDRQLCMSGEGIWDEYLPNQDRFVFAAKVMDREEFSVQRQGEPLYGKKGDYLVTEADGTSLSLDRVWIVKEHVFEHTYKEREHV